MLVGADGVHAGVGAFADGGQAPGEVAIVVAVGGALGGGGAGLRIVAAFLVDAQVAVEQHHLASGARPVWPSSVSSSIVVRSTPAASICEAIIRFQISS